MATTDLQSGNGSVEDFTHCTVISLATESLLAQARHLEHVAHTPMLSPVNSLVPSRKIVVRRMKSRASMLPCIRA